MTPILLTPWDVGAASLLILVDASLSLWLGLRLHRPLLIAAVRMVVQLTLVGYVLRFVFVLASPAVTLMILLLMVLIAGREAAARSEKRLGRWGNALISTTAIGGATAITAVLALTTAIRPSPWYAPGYAIPLAGIILGNVMSAASLSLDSFFGGVARERTAVEARLSLGESFTTAIAPLVRTSIRRGMLPTINTMSAAGIVTLPGIMTGQILAGLDPIEAVKYQILLIFLLAGGTGLAAAATAFLAARRLTDERQRLRVDRLR